MSYNDLQPRDLGCGALGCLVLLGLAAFICLLAYVQIKGI